MVAESNAPIRCRSLLCHGAQLVRTQCANICTQLRWLKLISAIAGSLRPIQPLLRLINQHKMLADAVLEDCTTQLPITSAELNHRVFIACTSEARLLQDSNYGLPLELKALGIRQRAVRHASVKLLDGLRRICPCSEHARHGRAHALRVNRVRPRRGDLRRHGTRRSKFGLGTSSFSSHTKSAPQPTRTCNYAVSARAVRL